MANPMFGYKNLVDDATLSANGSFSSSYPLSNLQSRRLGDVARSTTATKIFMDHGAAVAARIMLIVAHLNINNGDTVTLERGTSSGGNQVYAGSPLSAWPFTPLVGTRDGAQYVIPIIMEAQNSARYTTLTVPAGAQIGRIFFGPAFDPAVGATELGDDWRPTNSSLTRTPNGADWAFQRAEQRGEALVYPGLTEAEGDLLDEIVTYSSIVKEIAYIPDPDNRAKTQRRGFLGTMRALPKVEYSYWEHNGVAIGFEERGGAP